MSGVAPRLRLRQSAALTLVFGTLVATGAATGAWGAGTRQIQAEPAAAARPAPDQAGGRLASGGDRWAAHYSPQQYAGLLQELAGEYVGVGLWVARGADGAIAVSRVLPGTPAAGAGVRAGDRLLRIDGRAVSGLPVTQVVSLLRGGAAEAPGSPVALTLARADGLRRLTVRRRVLDADDVAVDHPARFVTRITVQAFSQGSGDEVRAAVRQAGVDDPAGAVLLDLRGCSGGLVAEAVEAASAFLDGGPVATLHTGDGSAVPLTAEAGGNTAVPLVVLVDSGTMSAAELLAGALQDRGRAVVVGSATFGKGTVQAPSTLADGSVVERTVARYTTPSGRSPDGTGIEPDVPVPLSASAAAAEHTALAVLRGLDAERAGRAAEVPQ